MLRKMFLLSPDYASHQQAPAEPPTSSPQQPKVAVPTSRHEKPKQRSRRGTKKKHSYDRWIKMKRKIEEADITRKMLIEKIADFLQSVLPSGRTSAGHSMPPPITPEVQTGLMSETHDTSSLSLPVLSRAHESVFSSPIKRSLSMDSDEGEASYVPGETTVKAFSEQQFGAMASPYIATYVFRTGILDKDFCMRRDYGTFRIGDSTVEIDRNSVVIVQGVSYKGTRGLFELLTRKKVDRSFITDSDMKVYRAIL